MSVQKRVSRVLVWVIVAGGCGLVAGAVQDGPMVPAVGPERAKLFSVPQLADLDIFVGAWKVKETYFDEKGVARDGRKGTEEIVWMLDHHALYRRYNTSTGDRVYRAVCTIAWSEPDKRYLGSWFDSAPEQGPSPRTISGSFDDDLGDEVTGGGRFIADAPGDRAIHRHRRAGDDDVRGEG